LGFDACVSHKTEQLAADLKAACPDGIDVYFENVGGRVFDAVLPLLNQRSRISLCGLISQYDNMTMDNAHEAWMEQGKAIFEHQHVQPHRLVVGTFVEHYQSQFLAEMAVWVREGKVKYKEDLWPGLEQAPAAFQAMMTGGNFGKTLVGVGEDPTLDAAIQERRAGTNVLGT
jgi:hypothetical protein